MTFTIPQSKAIADTLLSDIQSQLRKREKVSLECILKYLEQKLSMLQFIMENTDKKKKPSTKKKSNKRRKTQDPNEEEADESEETEEVNNAEEP